MRSNSESDGHRLTNALMSYMRSKSPRMQRINAWSAAIAIFLAVMTMAILRLVLSAQTDANHVNELYQSCQMAVDELQEASDFLTDEARQYVTTGERVHLDNYLSEIDLHDRRGHALKTLRDQTSDEEALAALEEAREKSDELAEVELRALRLTADATHLDDLPKTLANVALDADEAALPDAKKQALANQLVYGNEYTTSKFAIRDKIHTCSEMLLRTQRETIDQSNARLSSLLTTLRVSVFCLLLVLLFVIGFTTLMVFWPMSLYEDSIRQGKPLEPGGARELRYLVDAYNEMYEHNSIRTESLSHEAHNDALTGVLNRGSFNELLSLHKAHSALILVDVDLFKQFNDEYGHDMGDAILIEVSATLYASFRSTDYVCRIGGDEFAVIMTHANADLRNVIAHKIKKMASFLRDTSNGLPATTISVGVAFGWPGCTDDGLFQEADRALYEVKRRGRDGYAFADEVEREPTE